MRKVVIITRKEAYKSGKASDEITKIETLDSTAGLCKIHEYINNVIKTAFLDREDEDSVRFKGLVVSLRDPQEDTSFQKLLNEPNDNSIEEEFGKVHPEFIDSEDFYAKYYEWTFSEFIKPRLERILYQDDTGKDAPRKPYLQFTYKNKDEDIKVCFVFLDKILGLFVKSPNEYRNFLNNENKDEHLEFIKAICEDCDVKKGEENILYIHDKEWYDSNNEKLALYEGKWDPKYEREKYAEELGGYFKTIQVFTHNSPSFERIKELEFIFPEKDMELKIENRKYF